MWILISRANTAHSNRTAISCCVILTALPVNLSITGNENGVPQQLPGSDPLSYRPSESHKHIKVLQWPCSNAQLPQLNFNSASEGGPGGGGRGGEESNMFLVVPQAAWQQNSCQSFTQHAASQEEQHGRGHEEDRDRDTMRHGEKMKDARGRGWGWGGRYKEQQR